MRKYYLLLLSLFFVHAIFAQQTALRQVLNFDEGWRFHLGEVAGAEQPYYNDKAWRQLNLPHDWSIEVAFKKENPAGYDGGALPGGIGWYRKAFKVSPADRNRQVYIEFDGVYQRSDVWINGHHLGFRPNGYISFRYDLTPYLHFGGINEIAVKADNSHQPNSRWYSGSGIYRHVRLVKTAKVAVDQWGTFVRTQNVSASSADVMVTTIISNRTQSDQKVTVVTTIFDQTGKQVAQNRSAVIDIKDTICKTDATLQVTQPELWSTDAPYLYKVTTTVYADGQLTDTYHTPLGIRYFNFDADKGFSLNGKPMKILGVCNHHDLGALGAAVNTAAQRRQLQLLKAMGCNGIRTSHNPPDPGLLELCDELGFIVMDEAFDVWEKGKKPFDYHLFFRQWSARDLRDQVLRDRNHPSVFIWSIGNEIHEQNDTVALRIAPQLAAVVHELDTTRPITTANSRPDTTNKIISSGAVDLIGYNYHNRDLASFHQRYPGKKFIGSETTSALETRGYYDMPSDSIRRWPLDSTTRGLNADYTVSAYDNVSANWGGTHEETWKLIKKYPFLSGMYIWTGFDYLGEPTPYPWPARSSYFGILDLAGFPKDIYYMYQSEWTPKPVLHLFPHWNWQPGKTVDVWVFYSQADEVELYLNGKSLGVRKKTGEDLHVMWRVKFEPGELKAISRKNGKVILTHKIVTAGKPAKLVLHTDRSQIKADGNDLAFITVEALDVKGNPVPEADMQADFQISGAGKIVGVDNGDPVSHAPFKAHYRKLFHGKALVIVQAGKQPSAIKLTATSPGLQAGTITIQSK
ncbi:beta-galactosidase [Mucilaginibacter yixingensis]|uniref:Beta-galactosidase n=1 Tax=Mucilaginibacter yixingensis TaxID=1295612 RepID=A0A2T5JGH0_9SPHI|nr:beta-galactosidase GalB [Mucilaginibacter yixingensis]PTR01515.1 beta-galactosidase [Mucilaginibacter yixingensis]